MAHKTTRTNQPQQRWKESGETEAPGLRRTRKSGKYPDPAPSSPMALAEEPPAPERGVHAASAPKTAPTVKRTELRAPQTAARSSALVDTRVIYCGDCLEQLRNLPDGCVDLIYSAPPFNLNRDYEIFWAEPPDRIADDAILGSPLTPPSRKNTLASK